MTVTQQLKDLVIQKYLRHGATFSAGDIQVIELKRYWKVVLVHNKGTGFTAEAFYDPATGNVFNAASWTAPAKTLLGKVS